MQLLCQKLKGMESQLDMVMMKQSNSQIQKMEFQDLLDNFGGSYEEKEYMRRMLQN